MRGHCAWTVGLRVQQSIVIGLQGLPIQFIEYHKNEVREESNQQPAIHPTTQAAGERNDTAPKLQRKAKIRDVVLEAAPNRLDY